MLWGEMFLAVGGPPLLLRVFYLAAYVSALLGLTQLLLALFFNRNTSLAYGLSWCLLSWVVWLVRMAMESSNGADSWRYLALCCTACLVVANLGARRPQVTAWNLVVVGLLAVLLLPFAEAWILGVASLGLLRMGFLAAALLVGVVNYWPTRLQPIALTIGLACGVDWLRLVGWEHNLLKQLWWLPLLAPWFGSWAWQRKARSEKPVDSLWLHFRDRYGLIWALRVREQFNTAAKNAGWSVHLSWGGLQVSEGEVQPEMVETLKALLKRFEASE